MILDAFNLFEPLGGTAVLASGTSSNIIDLGVGRDLGVGDPDLKVVVEVLASYNNLTSLNVAIQGAPDNGAGAPGTFYTLAETGAVPLASLLANTKLMQQGLPAVLQSAVNAGYPIPRFLQLAYTVVGTAPTTGKLFGGLVLEIEQQTAYKPGVVVNN